MILSLFFFSIGISKEMPHTKDQPHPTFSQQPLSLCLLLDPMRKRINEELFPWKTEICFGKNQQLLL